MKIIFVSKYPFALASDTDNTRSQLMDHTEDPEIEITVDETLSQSKMILSGDPKEIEKFVESFEQEYGKFEYEIAN